MCQYVSRCMLFHSERCGNEVSRSMFQQLRAGIWPTANGLCATWNALATAGLLLVDSSSINKAAPIPGGGGTKYSYPHSTGRKITLRHCLGLGCSLYFLALGIYCICSTTMVMLRLSWRVYHSIPLTWHISDILKIYIYIYKSCTYVCLYIYMYIYIYIHTFIH